MSLYKWNYAYSPFKCLLQKAILVEFFLTPVRSLFSLVQLMVSWLLLSILIEGRILLTSKRLYFQAYNNLEAEPVVKIKLASIRRLIFLCCFSLRLLLFKIKFRFRRFSKKFQKLLKFWPSNKKIVVWKFVQKIFPFLSGFFWQFLCPTFIS